MRKPKEKKSASSSSPSVVVAIFSFLKEHKFPVTAIAGILGFYLTPVKDIIYHSIWDEKAVIAITVDTETVRIQDELKIYISVLPNSPVGVSEGFVTLTFPSDKLRLINNQSKTFTTPKIQSPTVLLDGKLISFIGIESGEAEISVEIKTRYTQFRETKKITVIDNNWYGKGITIRPSRRNFSGEWIIRIGHVNGKMIINDKGGNITGSYSLDNKMNGVIDGIRDGGIFNVSFYRKPPELKWEVNANSRVNEGFILIEGKAILYKIGLEKWVATNENETFIGTVQLVDQ